MSPQETHHEIKLLAWNILHGGGPERTPWIGLAMVEQAPDIVVLSEFRARRGGQLRAQLADAGLVSQVASQVGPTRNGMLLASRFELSQVLDAAQGRMLCASVLGVRVIGVHVPDDQSLPKKAAFFQQLTALARQEREKPCVILGDFNTARRGPDTDQRAFRLEEKLGLLETLGFVDAWRRHHPGRREDSWVSALGAGRLDGAYVSAPLAHAVTDARYEHGPREQGLSDHSMLCVRLRVGVHRVAEGLGNGLFGAGGV